VAELATIATIIAGVVSAGAAVVSTVSTIQAGAAQQQAMEAAAKRDELAGKNEFAAAQRQADERRLEGQLIMSKQQAYAAASGGGSGADAPTMAKILTDTGERVRMGTESVMYQGASARDDYFAAAEAKRTTGGADFFGSILKGVGTLAGGVGDALGRIPVQQSEVG
jgi:hypothetical protein